MSLSHNLQTSHLTMYHLVGHLKGNLLQGCIDLQLHLESDFRL